MPGPSRRPLARAALFAFALGDAGCGVSAPPCLGPVCASGRECLANRCVPAGARPVNPADERVVANLTGFAVAGDDVPDRAPVALFASRRGRTVLYLAFDPGWKSAGDVDLAFLLLEPAPGTNPVLSDVGLEVWTIGEPWNPRRIAAGDRPSLSPPVNPGLLRGTPPAVARIDVTPIVRALARREHDDGIAIVAGGGSSGGVAVLTGASGGAPRLELYVRPSRGHGAAW